MFQINQVQRHQNYLNVALPIEDGANEKIWEVTFLNGGKKLYNQDQLNFWPFFQGIFGAIYDESKKNEIKLDLVEIEIFEILDGLFRREEHLNILLKGSPYQYDPYLYERFAETYHFLHPASDDDAFLKDTLIPMFEHYDLEWSSQILSKFNEIGDSNDPPVLIQKLKEIECQRIYFESESEFEYTINKIKELALEIWALKKQKKKFESKLSKGDSSYMQGRFLEIQMLSIGKVIRLLNKEQSEKSTHSMKQLFRASQYIKSEDLGIKTLVISAVEKVEAYRSEILVALKKSGADMTRSDLLECLVGPKAFLYDYYGLYATDTGRTEFPFRVKGASEERLFGYQLTNSSPADIENEIRTDIERWVSHTLPDSILDDEVEVAMITPEAKELREYFFPIFSKWRVVDDKIKEEAITKIIQINEWERFNLQPNQFEIEQPTTAEPGEIFGEIRLERGVVRFHLRTYKFEIHLVDVDGGFLTSSDSTSRMQRLLLSMRRGFGLYED
ncbi:MAG: hypothetical protein K940chlam3_00609 [Chlamydiae bacterium]|nr:hypothetical protein [Chlamydiota bacterium]